MADSTLDSIRDTLTDGGSGFSKAFAVAFQGLAGWPVDACVTEYDAGQVRTVYWIQGNMLGWLTAKNDKDDENDLEFKGTVLPVSKIDAVKVKASISNDGFSSGTPRRGVNVKAEDGGDIKVDVAEYKSPPARERADEFIDVLLAAIARNGTVRGDAGVDSIG